MGEMCDFDVNGGGRRETLWSEEHDRIPLKQRLKILLDRQKLEDFHANEMLGVDANVKTEDEHFEYQVTRSACNSWEGMSDRVVSEESGLEECNRTEIGANESHEVFLDDLDHVVLKERQRILLSREVLGFIKPAMEGNISGLRSSAAFLIQQSSGIGNAENVCVGKDSVIGASHLDDIDENGSDLLKASPIATTHSLAMTVHCQGTTSFTSGIATSMHGHSRLCSSSENPTLSELNSGKNILMTGLRSALPIFANVKAETVDTNELQIPSKLALDNSFSSVLPLKNEDGVIDESLDDKIDHMFLHERMILRASKGSPSPDIYETSICSMKHVPSLDYCPVESHKPLRMKRPRKRRKTATDSVETALEEDAPGLLQALIKEEVLLGASHLDDIDENGSDLLKASPIATTHSLAMTVHCQGTTSFTSGIATSMHGHSRLCSSSENPTLSELNSGKNILSGNQMTGLRSALPIFANVKAEPVDTNELQIPSKLALDNSFSSVLPLKNKDGVIDESLDDKIDHMFLHERMILRASKGSPSPDIYETSICSMKHVPSLDYCPVESHKPLRMKRPRKRRKTATDSVETALEEDAPGLLQALIKEGVLLDELKLIEEMESDEVLDDSLTENSFAELEAVISKLFSQRQSLLKLPPIRCGKGERTSYCLACLISLVEQARYLQFRKWPVEWGWCRDLQSFIFIFKRHHRIVLERPEYGYATYFFELVDSLPIDWQIKRLVTAMKLTSCSRVALIENRVLKVGDDLTEGEARVLMDYGWVPDTGLGTMLNYCDRVYHDRKHEKDSSEWRTNIGKLLVDGYNGGTIVSTDIPKKVFENHDAADSPLIKLEPS